MGTCEMCGEQGDVKKTRVEGTVLKLCDDCQEVGEVVKSGSSSSRSSKQSSSKPSLPDDSEEIAPDFNERVKAAREAKELSVQDLADAMKEKKSVVQRVEAGKLAPDRSLARKFEKHLGVDLYEEEPSDVAAQVASTTESEQTIGDVAEVTKKDED